MFRSGDIVLYRLDVSQIKQIKQEKDRTFYLLYSLGSEYCEFKVPCDNAGGHLQSLPSKQTLEYYLDEMADLVCFEIPRNPGFQYYQNILNSVNLRDWCALLKTLYRNRCNALEHGKRFNQKQSQYYEYVLEKLATIYSFVRHQTIDSCKALLEQTLEQIYVANGA